MTETPKQSNEGSSQLLRIVVETLSSEPASALGVVAPRGELALSLRW